MSKNGPLYRPSRNQQYPDAPNGRGGGGLVFWAMAFFWLALATYGIIYGVKQYRIHIANERLIAEKYVFERDKSSLLAILTELEDAEKLAASSPRVALSTPVATLQAIGRKANGLNFKTDCMKAVKPLLATHIQEHIDGYLYFMRQKESLASFHLEQSQAAFDKINDKLKECSPDRLMPEGQ